MTTPVEGATSEIDYSTDELQGTTPDQSNSPGVNPAWNEVLDVLPQQFHGMVTPKFQAWDQSAQQRIEGIKSQYADYEAFREHGIAGEDIQQALRLAQAIEQDPEGVYKALAEAHKFGQTTEEVTPVEENTDGAPQYSLPPDYEKLQSGVEIMAQMMLEQQEAQTAAEAETQLDAELAAAKQKYGDFNEVHVLPYISHGLDNGLSVEQSVEAFMQMKNSLLQTNPRPFAPTIMGGNASGQGVGLPTQQVDVAKLSDKDTRSLVVQYLEAAAKQR